MATLKVRCSNTQVKGNIRIQAIDVHIRIVISNIKTGYTIQALKGTDNIFSDPAVIVPVYKADVWDFSEKNPNGIKVFSFNVTRDAWYTLGIKDGKHQLMNRAFIPRNWEQNLYGTMWIPDYPRFTGMGAFILTRFGKRKLPAQPLATRYNLDNSLINSPRKDAYTATDVMIHIGGTYEFKVRYDVLGGSFGCFAFIPQHDVYATPQLAEQASINDDYDDTPSNREWTIVTNKILNLAFPEKKQIKVLIEYTDPKETYVPQKILAE